MYGSSLRLVTRMPREARIAARDAAAMPFPREETTPPVTKTNLVMDDKSWKFLFYRNTPSGTNRETHRSMCGNLTPACATRMRNVDSRQPVERGLEREPGGDAGTHLFASEERKYRVERRRGWRSGDEVAQRHHDLGRLEAVPRGSLLERGCDRFALPRHCGKTFLKLEPRRASALGPVLCAA